MSQMWMLPNCLFFRDDSTAAFADSYCDEIEVVHPDAVLGADAHSISAVVSCAHGTGGRVFSGDAGLCDAVMDHLLCSICKARAGLMPALVFFAPHGGRTWRLCGADLHGCAVSLQNRTRRHNVPYRWRVTAIRCGCCSTRSMSFCMMAAVSEISLHCLSFQRSCRIC